MTLRLRVVGEWPVPQINHAAGKWGHQDSHPDLSNAKDCFSSLCYAAFLVLNIPAVSYYWGQSILRSSVDFSN